jgi:uncharacterized protein YciI
MSPNGVRLGAVSYFAVARERGPAWDHARPMHEQDAWADHATFMNRLAGEGFVVLGGPLDDGQTMLLLVRADTEEAVRAGLADDPWTGMELLRIASVRSWRLLLGEGPATARP